jgi:epoxyqueuosine reductase
VLRLCEEQGFAAVGICEASPSRYIRELTEWLEAGRHGSMSYLAEHLPARLDLGRILPAARSIIMVADFYSPRGHADAPLQRGRGQIARYARGRDYHKVMKSRLHSLCDSLAAQQPGESFRAFVDTAPLPEREFAARAGLGWTGKHTLLIAPPAPHSRGSYMLLGGILTTLPLSPAAAQDAGSSAVEENHCSACTRCIDACPTGAITPFSVDARRCISYLTIERRGPIAPEFHAPMGDRLYGCDICQEVCPHNAPISPAAAAQPAIRPEYASRFENGSLDLDEILAWTDDDRARILSGSAMKRATLAMLKRNALIVLANQALAPGAAPDARGAVAARCRSILHSSTAPELLRETARQSLERLNAHP